jgi:mono/diheme cytochrome c family protein
MAEQSEKDLLMDHDYDGIKELDNRLPPWWLYLFYITIIWSVGYMIYYHVLGTGDSSYEEYMKEMNPDWEPEVAESSFSIGYKSPFYSEEDLTPQKRDELALMAAQSAETGEKEDLPSAGDMNFEQLILAAMDVSTTEELDKLKTAFPDIWQKYDARAAQSGTEESTEAQSEPEQEIDPLNDEASLASGKDIFIKNCATCHGQDGEGGIGPNMTDDYYLHGAGMTNTVSVIENGVPAKGMISWRGILNEQQILEVASYIQTLPGTNPPNGKAPQGEKIIAAE